MTSPTTRIMNAGGVPSSLRRTSIGLFLTVLMLLNGCMRFDAEASASEGKHYALTIYGYNYTDRYIDEFSVDRQGGGNVFLSTPMDGGGKGVCCMGWSEGTPLPQTVRVRWAASACMKTVTNSHGEKREVPVNTFKEADVVLNAPVPKNPHYFEVHFYPDGHLEAAITAMASEPRLKLDPGRAAPRDVQYPKCKAAP